MIACLSIAGCNQNKSKNEDIKSIGISADTTKNKPADLDTALKHQPENLGDFVQLSPITILNPSSQNVYEKYGIEFTGNCYSCDLAVMHINKKNFDIVNVCDKNDFYRNDSFVYQVNADELKIKTGKNEFIFTKIDTAPIYELKILGPKITLKEKKFSKFYTQEKELKKFKKHDCEEFDG